MRIVLAGGTGLIGARLVQHVLTLGHSVSVLTRSPGRARRAFPAGVELFEWTARPLTATRERGRSDAGAWSTSIASADAVLNLAGASVAGARWTASRKQLILESRLNATRSIVDAIHAAPRKPAVLVNASAVGYYGDVPEGEVAEFHTSGSGFLADVCRRWEEEAQQAATDGVRVVLLRTGIVLDARGGALQRLVLPFRFFVGGPLGSGRQWMPWIHADDEARAIIHALHTPSLSGPLNLAAPQPVRMQELCETLGGVLRRPSWAPVPSALLRLVLGEMADVVLTGQKAIPKKLLESGFTFRFAGLEAALADLLAGGNKTLTAKPAPTSENNKGRPGTPRSG
ncbi:MAG: TIGR01777 family oxidoreductase [Bacteroidota bacterium]